MGWESHWVVCILSKTYDGWCSTLPTGPSCVFLPLTLSRVRYFHGSLFVLSWYIVARRHGRRNNLWIKVCRKMVRSFEMVDGIAVCLCAVYFERSWDKLLVDRSSWRAPVNNRYAVVDLYVEVARLITWCAQFLMFLSLDSWLMSKLFDHFWFGLWLD